MKLFKKFFKNNQTISYSINKLDYTININACCNGIPFYQITCIPKNNDELYIEDIKEVNGYKNLENQGHGSEMMKKLLEYANSKGFKKVTGHLSIVDKEHKDRLLHFYEKHGFKIVIYDKEKDCYFGEIIKTL